MDKLEKEKLFLQINGPELLAYRYIYCPQTIENGIKFGAFRCKLPINMINIIKDGDKYSIIYLKYKKPNFRKGTPSTKTIVKQIDNLTVEEVNTVLNNSFKYMEN